MIGDEGVTGLAVIGTVMVFNGDGDGAGDGKTTTSWSAPAGNSRNLSASTGASEIDGEFRTASQPTENDSRTLWPDNSRGDGNGDGD